MACDSLLSIRLLQVVHRRIKSHNNSLNVRKLTGILQLHDELQADKIYNLQQVCVEHASSYLSRVKSHNDSSFFD